MTEANGFPTDLVYCCQENAWCDTAVMNKWIEKVDAPYIGGNVAGYSHLLMDDFSSHKVGQVLDKLYHTGSFVSIMSGGSTSKVQVIGVSVNKPYKDKFRSLWVQWMAYENRNNELFVKRHVLAQWMSKVWWRQMSDMCITNGWKHCGYIVNV